MGQNCCKMGLLASQRWQYWAIPEVHSGQGISWEPDEEAKSCLRNLPLVGLWAQWPPPSMSTFFAAIGSQLWPFMSCPPVWSHLRWPTLSSLLLWPWTTSWELVPTPALPCIAGTTWLSPDAVVDWWPGQLLFQLSSCALFELKFWLVEQLDHVSLSAWTRASPFSACSWGLAK